MKVFVKPNGVELEVNESSEAYALSLGWKEKTPELIEAPAEEAGEEAAEEAAPQKRKYTRRNV